MERVKEVSEAFDKFPERYQRWFSRKKGKMVKEIELRAIRELIPEGRGLEVGVGSGVFASELGLEFGVDPSENLLQEAQSQGLKVSLGIGESLPFKENSFDFLLLSTTLSFLEDPPETLREARRVLSPEGEIVIGFIPSTGSWGELYQEKKSEGHDFYRHANFYRISHVEEFLEETGFKVERGVSTLFQAPGDVDKVEEPTDGLEESAGFCCVRVKIS